MRLWFLLGTIFSRINLLNREEGALLGVVPQAAQRPRWSHTQALKNVYQMKTDNTTTYKLRLRGTEIISFSPPPKFSTKVQMSGNAGAGYSSPGFVVSPSAFTFPSPNAGRTAHAAGWPLQGSLLLVPPFFISSLFPPFHRSGLTQARSQVRWQPCL